MRGNKMESFEYLLELSMALTEGQADPEALREAYEALVALDAERGPCAEVRQLERDLARR